MKYRGFDLVEYVGVNNTEDGFCVHDDIMGYMIGYPSLHEVKAWIDCYCDEADELMERLRKSR